MSIFRDTARKDFHSPRTEFMALGLPYGKRGRAYKYSIYQQIIDSLSVGFDELNQKMIRMRLNKRPQTFCHDTMDTLYSAELPDTYSTIEYFDGSAYQAATESTYADINDWYYKTVPTDLKVISSSTETTILSAVDLAPVILDTNTRLNSPSVLYVMLEGDAQYINNIFKKDTLPTIITIDGKDKYGNERHEALEFYRPDYRVTDYEYQSVSKISATYWDTPSNFSLTAASYIPYTYEDRVETSFPFLEDKQEDNIRSLFWGFDGGLLEMKTYTTDDPLKYHAGIKDYEVVKQFVCLDDLGVALTSIDAILPGFNSNYIYVLSGGTIFAYPKMETYSNTAYASRIRTNDPVVNLDVNVDTGTLTIKGEYNRVHINKFIAAYKVSLIFEDASVLVYDPDLGWDAGNGYITYALQNAYGFLSPTIVYEDIAGYFGQSFTIRLDIRLASGEIETDSYIVDKQTKSPIFAYSPSGIDGAYNSLCFDGKKMIKISNGTNAFSLMHENKEYFVSEDGVIIFAEAYDKIRIDSTTELALIVNNIFNELDQFGALQKLDRHLGEKSYDYVERLIDSYFHPGNSTRNGLIYGLSRELGVSIIPTIRISHSSVFDLAFKDHLITLTIGVNDHSETINMLIDSPLSAFETAMETLGFTVTSLNSGYYSSLTLKNILNITNTERLYGLIFQDSSYVQLPVKSGYTVLSGSVEVENMDEVQSQNELDAALTASYFVDGGIVKTNRVMNSSNIVNFTQYTLEIDLPFSPISVINYNDLDNNNLPDAFVADNKAICLSEAQNKNIYWN